jgi:hypothetical protein
LTRFGWLWILRCEMNTFPNQTLARRWWWRHS